MLVQLSIRDIVLIEKLDIGFFAGLSVLTGETGAGKSILLDSLSLALGGRGDGSLVRHGQDRGQVTAVFDIPGDHKVRTLLRDNDLNDDGDLIFKRVQSADGRTKASINDQPVSAQFMRQAGQLLVEIHGQHDDRALVETDAHRSLLDAFGGLSEDTEAVGT
ncbi:MAG: repair protein RecN, partial [Pseudomonadota bacterium]